MLSCEEDKEEYIKLASLDTLFFVVSNTTEAGIVPDLSNKMEGMPRTFPCKITASMYERFLAFHGDPDKGLILLPNELIEENGGKLKEYILTLAEKWALGNAFIRWICEANLFCNTLVDRIVTGYR